MVFDDIACENLNHFNPPTMDLVNIIRKLNEKFNVNSLSEEKLHGLIEEALQDAYKKGWMVPIYFNPSQNKKSGWMRKKENPSKPLVKVRKQEEESMEEVMVFQGNIHVPTGFQLEHPNLKDVYSYKSIE